MKKQCETAFGKKTYLLGKDQDGYYYWLDEATWDCDWYWGFGYVRTYTNNQHPSMSRDIYNHYHFDSMFFEGYQMAKDIFDNFFVECTLSESEKWKLLELMKTFYIIKEYSGVLYRGGSHYTQNPLSRELKNQAEYERINKVVLPKIFQEIYKLLEDREEKEGHECKYCGEYTKGPDEDVLCEDCRMTFGHTFFYEL